MKQKGYVVEVNNGIARVRVNRASACGGSCVSCKGCPTDSVTVDCRTEGEVMPGDCVELTMSNSRFFRNSYFGYVQTTLLMVFGAVIGYMIFKTDAASVIGAAAGLAAGILAARLVFSEKRVNGSEITARRYLQ